MREEKKNEKIINSKIIDSMKLFAENYANPVAT